MLITLHFREVKKDTVTRGKPFIINVDYIEFVRPTSKYKTEHSDIFTPSDPTDPYLVFESIDEIQTIASGLVHYLPK